MCRKKDKQKNEEKSALSITPEDIETLHAKYSEICKRIKADETANNTPAKYSATMTDYLLAALDYDVKQISFSRQLDDKRHAAELTARNDNLTPRYKRPWYRFFLRTPNKPLKIILQSAALSAAKTQAINEHENDLSALELEKLKKRLAAELLESINKSYSPISGAELGRESAPLYAEPVEEGEKKEETAAPAGLPIKQPRRRQNSEKDEKQNNVLL